jgi:hypothetical protein
MGNHWSSSGNLVIEDRTLFHQVGWMGQSGRFYKLYEDVKRSESGGFTPIYEQVATDHGSGWED